MTEAARHDAWTAGEGYDAFMGRWTRLIARPFLDWLAIAPKSDWLEVGCGTGALTEAIVGQGDPAHVLAVDPADGLLARARQAVTDPRVSFRSGDASGLALLPEDSFDVAVAGFVLNFVPDRVGALRQMARVVRPGGVVAFCVWDIPGGGLEFMRAFWAAAESLDPAAGDLTDERRFAFCTRDGMIDLARAAGLEPESIAIEAPSVFADFDDYWRPFTMGTGPAPGYCASLAPAALDRLRQRLSDSLPRRRDGSIAFETRAWCVKAQLAGNRIGRALT